MATLSAQLQDNLLRARALTANLTAAQSNWRPAPGKWSIAECLMHLNTTNELDLEPLRQAIADGRNRGITGSPPFHYGWLSRKFIAMQEPPVKSKLKSPAAYQPQKTEADLAATISTYERLIRSYMDLYSSAAGLDLARIKSVLPALPPVLQPFLKMPVGARFESLAAHDRRHLWQAEQVRAEL